jgi:hypothetical protein
MNTTPTIIPSKWYDLRLNSLQPSVKPNYSINDYRLNTRPIKTSKKESILAQKIKKTVKRVFLV